MRSRAAPNRGARPIWVSRAAQRGEPRAPLGSKGRSAYRRLGTVLDHTQTSLLIFMINMRRRAILVYSVVLSITRISSQLSSFVMRAVAFFSRYSLLKPIDPEQRLLLMCDLILCLTVATYDVPLSPTGAKGHVGGAARRSAAEPRAPKMPSN